MLEKNNEPSEAEEQRFKDSIKALMHKMEHLKIIFGLLFTGVMVLSFLGKVPFYSFFFVLVSFLMMMGSTVYKAIKCPRCQTSPFTKAGFAAQPFCATCGLKLSDKITIEEQVAEKYPDESLGGMSWQPLPAMSSNRDNVRLIKMNNGNLVFKPTKGGLFFPAVFIAVGVIFFIMMWRDLPLSPDLLSKEYLLLSIPLLFTLVGLVFLRPLLRKKEFIASEGVYKNGSKEQVLLLKVRGLQLLSHEVSVNDGSDYTDYQLNFVFHDNERRVIASYATKQNALKDAQQLADYLGMKLWSAVEI